MGSSYALFFSLSSCLIAEKERPLCADHKLEEALILSAFVEGTRKKISEGIAMQI